MISKSHRHYRPPLSHSALQFHISGGFVASMIMAVLIAAILAVHGGVVDGAHAAGGGLVAVKKTMKGIDSLVGGDGGAVGGDLSCPSAICTSCPSFLVPLAHSDEDISKVLANFCPQLEDMVSRGSNDQESASYMSPYQALGLDWNAMAAAGSCTDQQSAQIGFASDTLGLGIAVGAISLACTKGYTPSSPSISSPDATIPQPPQVASSTNLSNLQTFLINTGETPSGVSILGCDGYSYNGYAPGTGPGGIPNTNNDEHFMASNGGGGGFGTTTTIDHDYPALRDCYSMMQFGIKPTVPCPSCTGVNGIAIDTFRPALLPTIIRALGLYSSYFTPTAPTTYTPPPLDAINIYYEQLLRLFPALMAMDVGGFVAEEPNVSTTTTTTTTATTHAPPAKKVVVEEIEANKRNTIDSEGAESGAMSSSSSSSGSSASSSGSSSGTVLNTTTTTVIHTTTTTANTTTTPTTTTSANTTTTTTPTTTSAPNVTTTAPSFNPGPEIRTLSITHTKPVPETPPPTFHPGPAIRTLSASLTRTQSRPVIPPDGFNNTALVVSQVGLWYWATQVGRYRPPSGPLHQFIVDREKALSRVLCQVKGYPLSSSSSSSSSSDAVVDDPSIIPYSVRVQTSTHDPGFFPVIETSVYDAFTQLMTVATLGYHDFMDICPNPPSSDPGVSDTDQPIAVLLAALTDLAVWGNVGPTRWVLGLASMQQGKEVDVEITAMSLMCISEIVSDLTVQMVAAPFLATSSLKRPSAAHQAAADAKLAAMRASVKTQPMETLQNTLFTSLASPSTSLISSARRERLVKAAGHNDASPHYKMMNTNENVIRKKEKMSGGADEFGSVFDILQHLITWETILQASPIINTKYRICHINPTASFPPSNNKNTTFGGMYGLFNLRMTGTVIPNSVDDEASMSSSSYLLRSSTSNGVGVESNSTGSNTPLNPSNDPITDACKSTFVSFRATAMWVMGIGQGNFFTGRRGLPQHIQPTPTPGPGPNGQTGSPSFFELHETTVLAVTITTGTIMIVGATLAIGVQVWRARSKGSFYDSALDVEGVRESHYTAETDRAAITTNSRDRGTSRNQPNSSSPDGKRRGKSVGADGGGVGGSVPGSPVQPNNHSGGDGPGRGYGSTRSDPTGNIIGQEEDPSGGLGFF